MGKEIGEITRSLMLTYDFRWLQEMLEHLLNKPCLEKFLKMRETCESLGWILGWSSAANEEKVREGCELHSSSSEWGVGGNKENNEACTWKEEISVG